jgi:hypothetical protein
MRSTARLVIVVAAAAVSPSGGRAATPPTPIVVELFTSEGCSDCPAADALLTRLASTQPIAEAHIVALGEHVDYWDRQGWRDRFSSAALTRRQQGYGARFSLASIYTPQMVVDGRAELVGSDAADARRAIGRAASASHGTLRAEVEVDDNRPILRSMLNASNLPLGKGDRADIVVAITEEGLTTDVKAGENRGRVLAHAPVVRYMAVVGEATDAAAAARADIPLEAGWRRDRLSVAAFVQLRRGGPILASTVVPMPAVRR